MRNAGKRYAQFGLLIVLAVAISFTGYYYSSSGSSAKTLNSGVFAPVSTCGVNAKSKCVVGEIGPGGGTVFYVDSDNRYPAFDYLEIAPATWADDAGYKVQTFIWCDLTTKRVQLTSNNWSSRRVGAGKSNTDLMLAACKDGAANAIHSYSLSGKSKYTDWFLPSIGEISLMTTNLQGLGGLLAEDYWSSSEFSAAGAWAQSVGHGYQGSATKDTTFYVRPIRSF
jgi:hypothetical protein